MKTLILIATLLAFNILSFASGKSVDKNLAAQIRQAYYNNKSLVWTEKDQFSRASFMFNNNAVSVFKNDRDELIGFSINMKTTDLPKEALAKIADKYSKWTLVNAITFIDASGDMSFYATAAKNKNALSLHITLSGKVNIYARS